MTAQCHPSRVTSAAEWNAVGICWEEKASQAPVKELMAPGAFPKAELWPGGLLGPRRMEKG